MLKSNHFLRLYHVEVLLYIDICIYTYHARLACAWRSGSWQPAIAGLHAARPGGGCPPFSLLVFAHASPDCCWLFVLGFVAVCVVLFRSFCLLAICLFVVLGFFLLLFEQGYVPSNHKPWMSALYWSLIVQINCRAAARGFQSNRAAMRLTGCKAANQECFRSFRFYGVKCLNISCEFLCDGGPCGSWFDTSAEESRRGEPSRILGWVAFETRSDRVGTWTDYQFLFHWVPPKQSRWTRHQCWSCCNPLQWDLWPGLVQLIPEPHSNGVQTPEQHDSGVQWAFGGRVGEAAPCSISSKICQPIQQPHQHGPQKFSAARTAQWPSSLFERQTVNGEIGYVWRSLSPGLHEG